MKKILFLIVIIFMFGCSNTSKKKIKYLTIPKVYSADFNTTEVVILDVLDSENYTLKSVKKKNDISFKSKTFELRDTDNHLLKFRIINQTPIRVDFYLREDYFINRFDEVHEEIKTRLNIIKNNTI